MAPQLIGRSPAAAPSPRAVGSFGLALVGLAAAALGARNVLAFAAAWGLVSGVIVCCLPPIWAVRWQNSS